MVVGPLDYPQILSVPGNNTPPLHCITYKVSLTEIKHSQNSVSEVLNCYILCIPLGSFLHSLHYTKSVEHTVPESSYVSVGLGNLSKGCGYLHSIWLKMSLTELQVVLQQRQGLYMYMQYNRNMMPYGLIRSNLIGESQVADNLSYSSEHGTHSLWR